MTLVTQNKGQISVMWIGVSAPSNTRLIWFDTANNIHYYYNTTLTAWVPLATDLVPHDQLSGLQGGAANEYYHLTATNYAIANTQVKNSYGSVAAPLTSNNASQGYAVGSTWEYAQTYYRLVSFSGSNANWVIIGYGLSAVKNNLLGGADPDGTVNNATQGYSISSTWFNTANGKWWRLVGFGGSVAIWMAEGFLNKDTILDQGGVNEVSAAEIRATVDGTAKWVKVTVPYTSFSAAAMSKNFTIFTMEAGMVCHAVKVKHQTIFAGGAIATLNMTVGIAGDFSRYATTYNLMQAVSGTNKYYNDGLLSESDAADIAIVINAISTGANLDQLTGGSVEVSFFVSKEL